MDNESKRNNGILDRANAAILSRDFEQAARIYKGLLKSDPQNIELLSSLGNLYVKSGDDEKALAYFTKKLWKYQIFTLIEYDFVNGNRMSTKKTYKVYDGVPELI